MKYTIVVLAFLLNACQQPSKYPTVNHDIGEFDVIVVDSCEYLYMDVHYSKGYLTHKGNCKYCNLRQNGN